VRLVLDLLLEQRELWWVKVAEKSPPHEIVSTDYALGGQNL
jgi:hypothetical protein